MSNKVQVIDGVTIRDITPEYTGEELQERVNELAKNLIQYAKNRKKEKTA